MATPTGWRPLRGRFRRERICLCNGGLHPFSPGSIMTETTWVTLRRRLVERYDELRVLLTRRLGSEELARETLHETWLRLDRVDDVAVMQNPDAYLGRMALNLATDRQRLETRRARRSDVNAILEDIVDDAPGQAEKFESRRNLAIFEDAIRELSERRRAILIAARLDEEPHQRIAERFGISKRMVQIELKYALRHCKNRLEQK
jgi:RNA polymerase sigma-70 factor (ECF subfamily)